MFFEIKQLGRQIAERLREALSALPLSGPWSPAPIPVPVRPDQSRPPARRWHGVGVAVLAFAFVVSGTTPGGQADDSVETPCAVCRAWDASMQGVPQDEVVLTAQTVENGVILQATSWVPEVQTALWSMSSQRQRVLQSLEDGEKPPLCLACQANIQAFDALHIEAIRLPDGVLLLYTSARPEVVQRLHAMVAEMRLIL